MNFVKRPLSILLSLLMILSVFTIVPLTASAADGDTVSAEVHKWIKAKVVDGKYYSLLDLYQNFILVRANPDMDFVYSFDNNPALWNRTGDKSLQGLNKIVVNSFNDGSGNLNTYWGTDDSRQGDGYIYLSDELGSDTADWYAYTWETFTLTEHAGNAATCTEAGTGEYYTVGSRLFVKNGDTYEQVDAIPTIDATGHSLTAHAANDATCTEAGNTAYWECTVCGKFFSDELGENEIAEDSWVIPATGHDWDYDNPVWGTPVEDMFQWTVPLTFNCNNCEETKTVTATAGMTSEHDADCSEGGYTSATFSATVNGHNYTKTIKWGETEVDPEAHPFNLEHTAAVAATCTQAGNSEYWHCGTCDKYFSDEEGTQEIAENSWVIAALGHNLTHVEAVAANATTDGNIEYWYCDRCEKYFSDANAENEITQAETVIPFTGTFSLTVGGETTKYRSLADAAAAAPADGTAATIKPLVSGQTFEGFTTLAGQNITFDLDKKVVFLSTPVTITASSAVTTGPGALSTVGTIIDTQIINNYGTLTISGTQTIGTVTSKDGSATNVSSGSLYINLIGESGSTLRISGGVIRYNLTVDDNADISISGGYFKTKILPEWCADTYVPSYNTGMYGENAPYTVIKESNAYAKRVTSSGEEYYYTSTYVSFAMNNFSNDGDTIVLLKDCSSKSFTITNNAKKINVDLNGFSIAGMTISSGDVTLTNGTVLGSINVNAQEENSEKVGKLTIGADCTVNGEENGRGIIIREASGNQGYNAELTVYGIVNHGVFVMGNITEGDVVVNIEDGAVVSGGNDGAGIVMAGLSTVNVKDVATISGTTGIEVRAGKLNVTGGIITGGTGEATNTAKDAETTTNAGIAIAQHTTKLPIEVNVTGGTITGGSALYIVNPQGNTETENAITATISGTPTFVGTTDKDDTRAVLTVTGGTYDNIADAKDYAPKGYVPRDNGDDTYTIVTCIHDNMTPHAAVDPTCVEAGNSAYWECDCGMFFSDAAATTEIEENSWVIPATGVHTYGEPTWTWEGYESATATFTCTQCGDTQTENATITSAAANLPATALIDAEKVYTASVEFEGQTYTDPKAKTIAQLNGYTISLKDEIALNFYVYIDKAEYPDITATYSYGTDTYRKTDLNAIKAEGSHSSGANYKITCMVNARAMTDDIALTVKSGETTILTDTISIAEYAEEAAAYYDDNKKKLLCDMLNYGAAVQNYYGYRLNDLASDHIGAVDDQWTETNAPDTLDGGSTVLTADLSSYGITYSGATMTATSKTAIRLFFRSESGAEPTATVTVDNAASGWLYNPKYDLWYIEINGISAKKIFNTYSISFNGGDAVTYNAGDYYNSAMAGDDDNFKAVMKKMHTYYTSAQDVLGGGN